MGRLWNAFVKAVEKDPKKFAQAVIEYLDPPKYAVVAIRRLEYLCGWPNCWTVRTDTCTICGRSVCDEHSEMLLGPKTKLEWYVCLGCKENMPREEIMAKIEAEDEEFWRTDQG